MKFIWNSLHPPQSVDRIQLWERPRSRNGVVDVSIGEPVIDLGSASSGSSVLVVDLTANPRAVFTTVHDIHQRYHQVTLMMARTARLLVPKSTTRQRWRNAANRAGVNIATPGDQGWFRLDICNMRGKLDELFLPSELLDVDNIIAFPGFPHGNPFDFWRAFAHPHTRLRTEASAFRSQLAVELSTAVQANYIFRITSGRSVESPIRPSERLLIHTNDAIAARLIWLCAQQYLLGDDDVEQLNPWEDAQIQAAAELGIGVPFGAALLLRTHSASTQAIRFARFAADKLDCQLILMDESN